MTLPIILPPAERTRTQALFQKSLENWALNMLGAMKRERKPKATRKLADCPASPTRNVTGTHRRNIEVNFFHYTIYFWNNFRWQGTCQDSIENSYIYFLPSSFLVLKSAVSTFDKTKVWTLVLAWPKKFTQVFPCAVLGLLALLELLANPIQFCELNWDFIWISLGFSLILFFAPWSETEGHTVYIHLIF